MIKKRHLIALLIVLISPTMVFAVEDLLAEGYKHYKKFNNAKAFAAYQKAVAQDKNNFTALKMVVSTLNNQGEDAKDQQTAIVFFKQAEKQVKILLKKFPKEPDSYLYAALVYGNLAKNLTGEAKANAGLNTEKYAEKCIKMNPQAALAYVALGVYYREVANLDILTATLARAVTGKELRGTMELSEKTLQQAAKHAPNKIYAYYELAVTKQMMGKNKEAKKHYQTILKLPLWDHEDAKKQKIAKEKLKELK